MATTEPEIGYHGAQIGPQPAKTGGANTTAGASKAYQFNSNGGPDISDDAEIRAGERPDRWSGLQVDPPQTVEFGPDQLGH